MDMMLPRIKLNYHAYNPLVHSIFFYSNLNISAQVQEDNDQAFPVTL